MPATCKITQVYLEAAEVQLFRVLCPNYKLHYGITHVISVLGMWSLM